MKRIVKDEQGSIILEFAMVICIYMAVLMMFFIHGMWLYNNFQTDRAARQAALYLATTNNAKQAQNIAREYMNNTTALTHINRISVWWNNDKPMAKIEAEMETFFPGVKKLLDPKSPGWTGTVKIVKEASTLGEHQHTHREEYN